MGCPLKNGPQCEQCNLTDCPHRPDNPDKCDWHWDDAAMCENCPNRCPHVISIR